MALEFVTRVGHELLIFSLILTWLIGDHVGSETSYTWRLDLDVGKVMPGMQFSRPPPENVEEDSGSSDPADRLQLQETVMDILLSTVTTPDGSWKKTSLSEQQQQYDGVCSSCDRPSLQMRNNRGISISGGQQHQLGSSLSKMIRQRISAGFTGEEFVFDFTDLDDVDDEDLMDEKLDCGKSVNFTYYDHLVGIQNRHRHPKLPQPEVALNFKTKKTSKHYSDVNMDGIEKILKILKLDKPKSVELYNQQANYWRVKGDNFRAIECFRRALAVSPNNAEILLNMARVLFHLQFLDDAIFLTRRSLEVQPPDKNAWPQHFQLGEILKAYCHYQEAALHLRHVLELKPDHEPAIKALKEMESIPDATVHMYTIIIIVVLVLAVLLWIMSTLDISCSEDTEVPNKARLFKRLKMSAGHSRR